MDKRTVPVEGADNGRAGDKNGQLPYESGVAPEGEEEEGKRPDVEAGVDKDHKVMFIFPNYEDDLMTFLSLSVNLISHNF